MIKSKRAVEQSFPFLFAEKPRKSMLDFLDPAKIVIFAWRSGPTPKEKQHIFDALCFAV